MSLTVGANITVGSGSPHSIEAKYSIQYQEIVHHDNKLTLTYLKLEGTTKYPDLTKVIQDWVKTRSLP